MTMHMAEQPMYAGSPAEKGWVVISSAGVTRVELLAQIPVPCSELHPVTWGELLAQTPVPRSLSSRTYHLFYGKYVLNLNLADSID